MIEQNNGLQKAQFDQLNAPIKGTRVASRSQGGKNLSYLEAWDVKAHLIRIFGFTGFDSELVDYGFVAKRDYMGGRDNDKEMVEVIWHARVRLTVKAADGMPLATYVEAAVGSASGPRSMEGEHHDNAVKTAESDALKRCAINLGNQFGLSLYKDGSQGDVVRGTLVTPPGAEGEVKEPVAVADPEKEANLSRSVGVRVDTPEEAEQVVAEKLGGTVVSNEPNPANDVQSHPEDNVPDHPREDPDAQYNDKPFNARSKFGRYFFACWGDWIKDKPEITDADRNPVIGEVIQREITSTNDITIGEARKVLRYFGADDRVVRAA